MILVNCVSLSESLQIRFLKHYVLAWNQKHVLYSTFLLEKKSDLSVLSKESLNFNFAENLLTLSYKERGFHSTYRF